MITNDKLNIFEDFRIDYNLPKYKKDISNSEQNFSTLGISSMPIANVSNVRVDGYDPSNTSNIKSFFKNIFKKKRVEKPVIITPQQIGEFFNQIKTAFGKLSDNQKISLDNYENVVKQAASMGQTALVEKLGDIKKLFLYELQLSESDFDKYLTEKQISALYTKVGGYDSNLHLTWLKNFIRIIPQNITDLKIKADTLKVFDNYVVLHYDKKGTNTEKTKEEKEIEIQKKRDPILFGVIKDSRRLYYIGDWIDEYCDLTLDKLLGLIDDKSNEIDNKIDNYIN